MEFRFRNKKHRRPLVAPLLFHPRLEPLEDRRLLAAAPLHVDIDSTAATPDGLAWETAYSSLQDALDQAATLNTDADPENDVSEIWIAEGTYKPTALSDADLDGTIDTDPRSATFSLIDGVSLYGGFAGTETTLAERQPPIDGNFPHETILTGDLAGDDAPDIAVADLLDDASRQENAYTVVTATDLTEPATLDGLTIIGGNANFATFSCLDPNRSGGAIYTVSGTLTVINSTISGNSAYRGSGIYSASRTLTVTNSIISGNSATHGGGICSRGTLTVTNSIISRNSATWGGGIYNYESTVVVTNSTISGNSANSYGGGVHNNEGAVSVTNSTIAGNSARSSGGIGNHDGFLVVINSIVALNEAPSDPNISGTMALESGFNLIGFDPAFVRNPGPGTDAVWGTEDDDSGDLRLTGRSPALNTGSNDLLQEGLAQDLDGNARIFGGTTDIGAYEYQGDPGPGCETRSSIVTTALDTWDPCDGQISLREAVRYGDPNGTTVTFDNSLDGQEIVLAGSPIFLPRSATIDALNLHSLTINADGRSRAMVVYMAEVELIGLTITGGDDGQGGGIANRGTLIVTNSTVSANSAKYDGGGIYNDSSCALTVTNSTISDNLARSGGGIYNRSGIVSVTNSTILGNSSTSDGGGIHNYNPATGRMTVTHSTISGNSAGRYGGGIYKFGSLTAHNTIVAANSALNAGPDVYRNLAGTSSHNLIGDGSGMSGISDGVNGNLVGTATEPIDPLLGPLGDYGGATWTMPLLAGSPAIDMGNPAVVDPPLTDQRGGVRIVDGDGDGVARIDMGAFEYSPGKTLLLDRRVLYGNSGFDGDEAIATDKVALRPGEVASFFNYTSYEKGINGIAVDIAELADPDGVSAADFLFRVGNDSEPNGWPVANSAMVLVRQGEGVGGSDRVVISWPDDSIVNRWLQVTVKANERTGLLEEDVFYFGNAVGEAGDQPNNAIVNATDEIVARNFQHSVVDRALVDDPYDYNRDGLVNGTDQIIARNNQTNPLTMLRLISPPVAEAAGMQTEMSAADPDWFYEFQQTDAKKDRAKKTAVEAAIDRLLAVEAI